MVINPTWLTQPHSDSLSFVLSSKLLISKILPPNPIASTALGLLGHFHAVWVSVQLSILLINFPSVNAQDVNYLIWKFHLCAVAMRGEKTRQENLVKELRFRQT